MDDENQNPETPDLQTPESTPPTTPVEPLRQKPPKVIQPSEGLVKEMASVKDSYYIRGNTTSETPKQPAQPSSAPSQPTQPISASEQPATNTIASSSEPITSQQSEAPKQVRPIYPVATRGIAADFLAPVPSNTPANTANIYPVATSGIGASSHQIPLPGYDNDKEDSAKQLNFSSGYETGKSIFWTQIVVGFIAGIIFYAFVYGAAQYKLNILILVIVLLEYFTFLILSFYIPYRVLSSEDVIWPAWLALFGATLESIMLFIFGAVAFAVFLLIFALSANKIASSGISGSFILFFVIFILLAVIIDYFVTRLTYGITFHIFGKINDQKKAKIFSLSASILLIIISSAPSILFYIRAKG